MTNSIDIAGYFYKGEEYNPSDLAIEFNLKPDTDVENYLDALATLNDIDRNEPESFDSYDFPSTISFEELSASDWRWMGWAVEQLSDETFKILEGPFRGENGGY